MADAQIGVPVEPPRRQRMTGERRREQLVRACAYLIASKGYSSTSIREIAAHAGVSTSTVLHHFGTKEDLLMATLVDVSEDFQKHAYEVVQETDDPAEQLRLIGRAMLDSPRHDVGWRVWTACWQEAALNPVLQPIARVRNELWESFVAGIIEAGCARGQLRCRRSRDAARHFAALLAGVALHRAGDPSRWGITGANGVVDQLVDEWLVDVGGRRGNNSY